RRRVRGRTVRRLGVRGWGCLWVRALATLIRPRLLSGRKGGRLVPRWCRRRRRWRGSHRRRKRRGGLARVGQRDEARLVAPRGSHGIGYDPTPLASVRGRSVRRLGSVGFLT